MRIRTASKRVTRAANQTLGRFGYEVHPRLPAEQLGPEFERLAEMCGPFTMIGRDRLYANYQAARHVVLKQVPGDVVECGVWRGGSSMMFALTLAELGEPRDLWLFDTFEGMPAPSDLDASIIGNKKPRAMWAARRREDHNEWCYAPIETVAANLRTTGYPTERIHLVKGRVQDTIPHTAPERIAILRLDTDWHDSTRHELEHLYPRLQPGGVLLSDDYGEWAGHRKAIDEYLAEHDPGLVLMRIDRSSRVAIRTR